MYFIQTYNLGDLRISSFCRYATLLASQGCLKSALTYLGDTSTNPQLQELKERLQRAINAPAAAAASAARWE